MLVDEYQRLAVRTAGQTSGRDAVIVTALGLAGEAGEYADLIKKELYHGHPVNYSKRKKEIGDIIWYAAVAAYANGWTLSEVLDVNIKKLELRYPEGFSVEASIARVDCE